MPWVIKRSSDGMFVGPAGQGPSNAYVDSITKAWEFPARAEAITNCCAGEIVIEIVSKSVHIPPEAPKPGRTIITVRPRESVSAVEVLERLSNKRKGDPYGPERIFALGLIEAALSEITNGR